METRGFGRTGHQSTVAIFGAVALDRVDQKTADGTLELLLQAGVNHIDVAPSYGEAESRVGPWMRQERARFFLGCKTLERTSEGAQAELQRSLTRLQTDHLDLYQLHAVTSVSELDAATVAGGALEALVAARQSGLTRYLGITSHGNDAPGVLIEALNRFAFDSVLFPVNFVMFADPIYREKAERLLRLCRQRGVGVMTIKAIAKRPWRDPEPDQNPWYEPFSEPEEIARCIRFVLTQDVTGICTTGDLRLLGASLEACARFTPMSPQEQAGLLAEAGSFASIFE
jgi:aryl-alcohol dehydrogenase-like predicted oxidoreductase